MPIYAYRCDSCGFAKDVLQKRSDPAPDSCPSCGQNAFRKQLTAPAFQLKGSGWYVTDFRDNGKAKTGDDKSGGEAASPGAPTAVTAPPPASSGAPAAGGAATPAPAPAPAPAASSASKDT
jgi:putative FmdB family regulatory protein